MGRLQLNGNTCRSITLLIACRSNHHTERITRLACLLVLCLDGPLLDDEDGVRGGKKAHGDDHHDGRGEAIDSLPQELCFVFQPNVR